ncbi:MAG: WYL domain-containing protein [Clostridia bacterium]|nr:WYL domain-containing protein [Clostridia bacterium]
MAQGQIKKLYIMQTLEILKKYSDVDHHLKQQDIIDYMKKDYDVICERKSVARNISNLQDLGYDIVKDNGYYLDYREFEDSELRLLIDSVLASRHIPLKQSKELIDKLVNQSSVYFRKQMRHVANLDNMNHVKSNVLFYNIDILSEAIEKNRQVVFFYNKVDKDLNVKHTTKSKHLVNPYQIVVANGRYYLIGNIDKYDNVTHFRVEKISDIQLTDGLRKDPKLVTELKDGLNLPKHMVEHIYMFSGESDHVTLKVKEDRMDDIIDWLGQDFRVLESKEGFVTIMVMANLNAMKYWAIQFGEAVQVLAPEGLRREVINSLDNIRRQYE